MEGEVLVANRWCVGSTAARVEAGGGVMKSASTSDFVDRAVGFLLLVSSLALFCYYTCWVLITPLLKRDHYVQSYFLALEYAVIIPIYAGIALLSLLVVFVGIVMARAEKHEVTISDSHEIMLTPKWIAGKE